MAANIRAAFERRNTNNEPVFVAFITAGFPHPDLTVPILQTLEANGADVIELGVPYSDPIADGVVIQDCNVIALEHGITYRRTLDLVSDARKAGVKVPIILMGYYNPMLSYGEQAAVKDARQAGADGFIIVDVPPEEAVKLRGFCLDVGMSLIPLIAPSTSDSRIRFLSSLADSFLYVVSRMGTTGALTTMSASLPDLVSRIRSLAPNSPLAVGFGVSTRAHFAEVGEVADGVVIGSRVITAIKNAKKGEELKDLEEFCKEVTMGRKRKGTTPAPPRPTQVNGDGGEPKDVKEAKEELKVNKEITNATGHRPVIDAVITSTTSSTSSTPADSTLPSKPNGTSTVPNAFSSASSTSGGSTTSEANVASRYGEFGGQYVPEALYECLQELEAAYETAKKDPAFWKEWEDQFGYMGRPSSLYEAERLTEHVGGARIWFKREDLNHTGSHKINNAIGQILLARRIGKKRIIAETGAGQHGVATATVCAKFGLECIVYMGAEDVRRQALNVFRMKMLGAKVVAVASGSKTLKDAINEAMRDWVTNLSTTHYLVGSAIGPHPFPLIVRDFQSVIGTEIKSQFSSLFPGKLPTAVVACVGGGSNAIGTFYPFVKDTSVRLIGVEAAGDGVDTARHSATLAKGTKGVLHGVRTYIIQDDAGQASETHSISAGLDYPGVGPEHAWLKDVGRAEYTTADDVEALRGFRACTELEGIIPALESSHAIWGAMQIAKQLPKEDHVVLTLSGRGDKDVQQILEALPEKFADKLDWHIAE